MLATIMLALATTAFGWSMMRCHRTAIAGRARARLPHCDDAGSGVKQKTSEPMPISRYPTMNSADAPGVQSMPLAGNGYRRSTAPL